MRAIAFAILAHAFVQMISSYYSSRREPRIPTMAIAAALSIAAIGCALIGI